MEGRLRAEQAEEVPDGQEGVRAQPKLLPQLPLLPGQAGLLEYGAHHELLAIQLTMLTCNKNSIHSFKTGIKTILHSRFRLYFQFIVNAL